MTKFLLICAASTFLMAGSCQLRTEPVDHPAQFCDLVTDPFKWTQDEFDARAELWPANLRREISIRKHWDRECVVE